MDSLINLLLVELSDLKFGLEILRTTKTRELDDRCCLAQPLLGALEWLRNGATNKATFVPNLRAFAPQNYHLVWTEQNGCAQA